ncbi:MBL fold metallo-hydrolase, partial [Candidatus Bathyarchaeota archaeon]
LFAGSVGRTDLPESSWPDMASSLAELAGLPDQVRVYPGHGPPTTIGREKERNPFVRRALASRP